MFRSLSLTLTAAALAASPSLAAPKDPPAGQPATAMGTADPAKAKTYCYDTGYTGSRITRRECKSYADWRREGVDPLKDLAKRR